MRTVYTRSVEQWKTERSKQVFPLINTELFFPFPNRLINNCDSARSKHLCKQQLLGTLHIRISQSAEARASADVGCEQNTEMFLFVFPPRYPSVSKASPAHVSGCGALATASLVHGLDHHPAGAAHPAL